MKKNLLFTAAIMAAFGASAQIEVGFMDAEALGVSGAPTLAENTLLVATENVAMYWENEGEASSQNPAFNGFKQIIVNGETVDIVTGIGGQVNPSAVTLGTDPTRAVCNIILKLRPMDG